MSQVRPVRSRGARVGAVLVLVVWVALALALHRRNAVWESQRALWEDALGKSPCSPRAHLSLGFALREQQRYPEAIEEYRKGLACAEGQPGIQVQLLRNLGAAYMWVNRYEDAAAVLHDASEKAPEDPEILTNLAVVWLARRDLPLARVFAKRALGAAPDMGHAWNVLGLVQMEEGNLAEARASLQRAVDLDPDEGVRSFNLGKLLERQGDAAGACQAFRRALQGRLAVATRREVDAMIAARCGVAGNASR